MASSLHPEQEPYDSAIPKNPFSRKREKVRMRVLRRQAHFVAD